MTYPKVSHTDATSVPSSPRFPEIEEDTAPLHYLCNEYPS